MDKTFKRSNVYITILLPPWSSSGGKLVSSKIPVKNGTKDYIQSPNYFYYDLVIIRRAKTCGFLCLLKIFISLFGCIRC